MRQLHFVGLTEDGTSLVLQPPDGGENYGVTLDAVLRHAVASVPLETPNEGPADVPDQPTAAARPPEAATEQSPIVPREIQIRVRAGESPEHVAESLGVPLERIVRFAAAAVDERRRIAEEARRARARHTAPEGAESKVVVFGEAVDARFTAHGISAFDVRWDSHRREDGEWIVVARWLGGSGEHEARWVFSRAARNVTPVDDAAADLLSDRPIRPVAPPPAPRLVVAPPLVPGVVAFPPMPDAHTGPIPAVEEVFDQEAQEPQPLRPAFLREARPPVAESGGQPVAEEPLLDFDAPPLPLGIADPPARPDAAAGGGNRSAAKREHSDEERAARARIPSWDDILLGVRRKSD
jgi:DUF3071 family protein